MERNLTIRVKIWLFFMMFVCIVFILMWILQVVFLERFYEAFKIADIAKSAKILSKARKTSNLAQKDASFFVGKRKNILLFDKNIDIM